MKFKQETFCILSKEKKPYVTVTDFGQFLLKKPAMWLPVAAVVYAELARTRGGTSAVFKALIRDLMTIPQPCRLHVGLPLAPFRIAGVIADMDAQRAVFASKGSAGWKPCLFCSNIRKDLEHLDASIFFTVASNAVSQFAMPSEDDLFEAYDYLLRDKPTLSKKDDDLNQFSLFQLPCLMTGSTVTWFFYSQQSKTDHTIHFFRQHKVFSISSINFTNSQQTSPSQRKNACFTPPCPVPSSCDQSNQYLMRHSLMMFWFMRTPQESKIPR